MVTYPFHQALKMVPNSFYLNKGIVMCLQSEVKSNLTYYSAKSRRTKYWHNLIMNISLLQVTALKIKHNPFAKAFLDAKERPDSFYPRDFVTNYPQPQHAQCKW